MTQCVVQEHWFPEDLSPMINRATQTAIWLAVYMVLALTYPLPLQARIGETYAVIASRLGQPNVEQTDKGIYSWAVNEEQSLFLTVILP